jgi:CheY-like chemotaxis protein
VTDDRPNMKPTDRVVLITEDDLEFAGILLELARKSGLKGILARDGETALDMARRYPTSAIALDIQMPGLNGWEVLDELKRNPRTRHIPVLIVSGADPRMGMAMGAIAYVEKPATAEALTAAFKKISAFLDRSTRELLLVEDDPTMHKYVVDTIGTNGVNTTIAATAGEGLEALENKEFDCVVLDLVLPDMSGAEFLKQIKRDPKYKNLPVIVYTAKELNKKEEATLKKHAACVIAKSPTSSERLIDATALYLHRPLESLSAHQRKIVEAVYSRPIMANSVAKAISQGAPLPPPKTPTQAAVSAEAIPDVSLAGRKILVVDDDVRNIFALTSTLERQGMNVLFDERGKDAIRTLDKTPDIEVVLMDVMMPEMDGYETMQAIRKMKDRTDLPIIAITAKAMAGDREKCIEAGASEYLSKPVDTAQLFAMIKRLIAARSVKSSG